LKDKKIKYSICISGAAAGESIKQSAHLAVRLGAAIARRGHVVTTGATVGLPYYGAKGAVENGGMSIGFSPARSLREHLRKYRLPINVFDYINYTGMSYVGRDQYLVQSSDAVITVGGRFGSLHEFVTALEAHKVCGVLLGSGGSADVIESLLKVIDPHMAKNVLFDENPEALVEKVVSVLDREQADVAEQLDKEEFWYLEQSGNHAG
jgi:uncharacterized protein (TIGR00725 family)